MKNELKSIQAACRATVASELFCGRDNIHDVESSGWNITFTINGIRCYLTMDPPCTECVPAEGTKETACPSE